jgi:hypothetical protein
VVPPGKTLSINEHGLGLLQEALHTGDGGRTGHDPEQAMEVVRS